MQNSNGVYTGKEIGDFILQQELGRGSFGCVYKCQNLVDQSIHAIKIIEYKSLSFKGGMVGQLLKDEINSLSKVDSPNVLKLEHYIQTKNRCYIIMEYCDSGDLLQYWLKQNRILNENKVIDIIQQVLKGLKELHKNKIVHRDLKLANILLNKDQVKLADLGFCKMLNNQDIEDKLILGSPGTIAPEVYNKESYGLQSDIFSIGCIFYQLLFGELPFKFSSREVYLKEITEQNINFLRNGVKISQKVQQTIQRMLVRDPKNRLTFPELYEIDLFKLESQIQNINQDDTIKDQIQQGNGRIINQYTEKEIKQQQTELTQFYENIYSQNEHLTFKTQDFKYIDYNVVQKENQEQQSILNQKESQSISQSVVKLVYQQNSIKYIAPLEIHELEQNQKQDLIFKTIHPKNLQESSSTITINKKINEYNQILKALKFCKILNDELNQTILIDDLNLLIGRFMLAKTIQVESEKTIQEIQENFQNLRRFEKIILELSQFCPFKDYIHLLSKIQQSYLNNLTPQIELELRNQISENFSLIYFQGLFDILSYLRDETNKEPDISKKKNMAIIILKVQNCVNFHDLCFSSDDIFEEIERTRKLNIIDILKKIKINQSIQI